MMFGEMQQRIPDLDVVQLELPGRGLRFKENNAPDMRTLAEDLAGRVITKAGGEPYILLGFCYGAVVAYAVYQELLRQGGQHLPAGMIVMSSLPPGMHSTAELLFTMSNYKLMKHLMKTIKYDPSGITGDSAESGEAFVKLFAMVNPSLTRELQQMGPLQLLMSFLYPSGTRGHEIQQVLNVLKEDGRIMSAYDPGSGDEKIGVPLVALHGTEDEVVRAQDMDLWEQWCSSSFSRGEVKGPHMMLLDSGTDAYEVIARAAASIAGAG